MRKIKYSREKHLETILKQLLVQHFHKRSLEWSYIDGCSLVDIDRELYLQIMEVMPEVVNAK